MFKPPQILEVAGLLTFAAVGLHCDSSGDGTTTGGGGTGASSTTSASGGAGGGTGGNTGGSTTSAGGDTGGGTTSAGGTASGGSGGGVACSNPDEGLPAAACTPSDPSCLASASVCLAVADHEGKPVTTLRIAEVAFSTPALFTNGLVGLSLENGLWPARPECQLYGDGTFSWLLQLDFDASTLTTGGAEPVANGVGPYTFVDGDFPALGGGVLHAGPATAAAELDAGCGFSTAKIDVNVPWYLASGSVIVLPWRALSFAGAVSGDHNCIGAYNAEGLMPANQCLGGVGLPPTFVKGAGLSAHLPLEDADLVLVPSLDQSLCVALTGDAGSGNPARCVRDNQGQIVAKGDWCSATDAAATPMCADAIRVVGDLAASAVEL